MRRGRGQWVWRISVPLLACALLAAVLLRPKALSMRQAPEPDRRVGAILRSVPKSTAGGRETMAPKPGLEAVHPAILAAFQVLASLTALLAFPSGRGPANPVANGSAGGPPRWADPDR